MKKTTFMSSDLNQLIRLPQKKHTEPLHSFGQTIMSYYSSDSLIWYIWNKLISVHLTITSAIYNYTYSPSKQLTSYLLTCFFYRQVCRTFHLWCWFPHSVRARHQNLIKLTERRVECDYFWSLTGYWSSFWWLMKGCSVSQHLNSPLISDLWHMKSKLHFVVGEYPPAK